PLRRRPLMAPDVQRVAVIGSGGAGKSVFSRELAERSGLPVIHLDREFWRPNWEPTPENEWADRVRSLAEAERWVMDGNYSHTMEIRFARADTVVFLDLPRLLCIWSVVWRWARFRNE